MSKKWLSYVFQYRTYVASKLNTVIPVAGTADENATSKASTARNFLLSCRVPLVNHL